MKKIFLLLAVVAGTILTSCEGPQGPQGPTGYSVESENFEIRDVDFFGDANGYYGILYELNPEILNSDMVLVYRLAGVTNDGLDIWETIPETIYFPNGEELDYDFDFTRRDISIYLGYTSESVLTPAYTQNQVFRVVIIPGYLSNKVGATDYDSVTRALKISDADFTQLTKN
ncbi:hypothetical protein [Flavobacterium caeni]|uniref:Uncharacterized protein n=1 Tax=Flavobacterium caeni TaxID=490189 RepID=A0A1G5JIH6_9FLAO|nr:hypothetical protein [Flavobacterium caeni]SCY88165.1 hypothetical protein SAMN02927903_02734 [Flavobacterium caeni]